VRNLILEAVLGWSGRTPEDDVTVLVIRRHGVYGG
jgi:hypothetical protein